VVTNRLRGDEPGFPEHQGMPTSGRNSSVTLATSVQTLLDRMKRRKFSMPRPFAGEATFEPEIRSSHPRSRSRLVVKPTCGLQWNLTPLLFLHAALDGKVELIAAT
jgi:hypothetical protein